MSSSMPTSSSSEAALALGYAFIEAMNNHDVAAMGLLLSPDVKFAARPLSLKGPSFEGRDTFLALFRKALSVMVDPKVCAPALPRGFRC